MHNGNISQHSIHVQKSACKHRPEKRTYRVLIIAYDDRAEYLLHTWSEEQNEDSPLPHVSVSRMLYFGYIKCITILCSTCELSLPDFNGISTKFRKFLVVQYVGCDPVIFEPDSYIK